MHQKRTIIDGEELFGNVSNLSEFQNSEDGFEKYWEWPGEIGNGFMYMIKIRPGLMLGIGNYRLCEHLTVSFEMKSSSFVMGFSVPANIWSTFAYRQGKKDFFMFKSGQSYISYLPGWQGIAEYPIRTPIRTVGIYIDPLLLNTFMEGQHDRISSGIHDIVNGANEKHYHHALTTTSVVNMALHEMLNCPYQGSLKRLYLESRNQLRIKDMDEPISLRQRLWLDCYLGQDWIRGFASAYFDYDPAVRDWTDNNDEIYYVALNEAYLTVDTERLDFIFGKKMMRWGTGDGINPMDLINPRGYRDPITSARADARLPILLANGIFLLGPVTVEGVLVPKAEVNKFSLPNSPWEAKGLRELRRKAESGEIVLTPGEEPDEWFKDAEFAFKVSTVRHGFDLALLYYNGYTDDPVYHRDYLTDGRMRFTPRYHRYQAYGFNFAKGFERVTIRGEVAVKPGLLFSIDPNDLSYKEDSDGLVARDLYQGVIGIDRTFFTNLYVNFQFFADLIEGGQEALAARRKTHGVTFEISDKFLDDDLTAGFRGMYYTSHDGSASEIFAEYKIGDNWQIAPGYMTFNGPKDSRLGQFSHNDMIYIRLRYNF